MCNTAKFAVTNINKNMSTNSNKQPKQQPKATAPIMKKIDAAQKQIDAAQKELIGVAFGNKASKTLNTQPPPRQQRVALAASLAKEAAASKRASARQLGPKESWAEWDHVHDNGIHQYRRRKGVRHTEKGYQNVMHVQGTELLTTFSGNISEATRIYQLDVNPMDVGVELPVEALPYDECEWNLFEAFAVPATNLQGSGQVIMAFANDPANPIPPETEDGNRLMSSWKHDSFAIWEKGRCSMPTKNGRKKYYIHEPAPGEVDDQRMTVAARLFAQAMTDLTPADGGAACVLYAKYDVVLIDPSLDADAFVGGTLISSGKIDIQPNSVNTYAHPFTHVYESAADGATDPDATVFQGDVSFARKVSDDVLILEKGQYFATIVLGGEAVATGVTTGMDINDLPDSVATGADATWLVHGYSGVADTPLGVGACGAAHGQITASVLNPNNESSGAYSQLDAGTGSYQATTAPLRTAYIITNGFTVYESGTPVNFTLLCKEMGLAAALRSYDLYLSRVSNNSDPTNDYIGTRGSFSRALLAKYVEKNRPWRIEANENAMKKKLSKLDPDDLSAEELLIYNVLMDKKITRTPAFFGAIAPVLLELLKHAGIAVGGAVLKHAVGKFEKYCKKHEKSKEETKTSES